MEFLRSGEIGKGVDARPEDRPGVPMVQRPPRPFGKATWSAAPQTTRPSVVDPRRGLTPVYGSANPPRGLSGVLRRIAYAIPGYQAKRWLLLMVADRVDVVEHNKAPLAFVLGGLVLGIVGFSFVRRRFA